MLMNVAGAPSRRSSDHCKAQLGIMLAGKLIEFTGTRHFFQHVWKLGGTVDGIGKSLGFDDKL